ncbi:hypothetical protein C8R43DRAFT_947865 [Mycena crocata]|nr:hypothetical protein C8R43DRAFT_947865 [Mycena crocata]
MAKNTKGRAERLQQIADEEDRERGSYATDIDNWVCPCESFLRSRFLINTPINDLRFFLNLRRNHYPPYYSIPGIHDTDENDPSSADESEPSEIVVLGVRGAVLQTREQVVGSSPTRPTMQSIENSEATGNKEGIVASQEARDDAAPVATSSGAALDMQPTREVEDDDDSEEAECDRDDCIQFPESRKLHLKRCFEDMMGVLDNTHGVHPETASILETAFGKIERIGGDIGKDKRRRTHARTWEDNNSTTMYLD